MAQRHETSFVLCTISSLLSPAASADAPRDEADDIRSIREQFGLTRGELARLLHLGANTISRCESGRNGQTAAMDVLTRLIRDLSGSIDYLRRHAA